MITITIITIKIIITRAINMLKIKLITSLTSFAIVNICSLLVINVYAKTIISETKI